VSLIAISLIRNYFLEINTPFLPMSYYFFVQDPIDVPYSAESRDHEDKECPNKVNDDILVIQSAKEIVAGMQENKEMQNEAKAVHAES
jgi:hypothetical protein